MGERSSRKRGGGLGKIGRRGLLGAAGGLTVGVAAARVGFGGTPAQADVHAQQAGPMDATLVQEWQSSLVYYDDNGSLVYESDEDGNQIPDFSHAGYAGGDRPVPDVPTAVTISPIDGDNTAHIQAAIDEAGQLPLDDNGLRGAVLLEAGEYPCSGSLLLNHDGVVLRGVDDQDDPATSTVIRATGDEPHQRDFLIVGGGADVTWSTEVPDTRTDITSERVTVGSRSFAVADASALSVGDNVIIYHPCTEEWLAAIDYGATGSTDPWEVDERPIYFNRHITAIDGNEITVDVPVFNHLDRSLSQSYLYVWDRAGLVTNVGVEHLRIDIEAASDTDENHAWNAIVPSGVEDFWLSDCTVLHFGLGGIWSNFATRGTVDDCRAFDPASEVSGGRRYNFGANQASQQILFHNCQATHGRHAYAVNGTSSASGVVFLRSKSTGSLAASEGHHRWSQGLLYDNHTEVDPVTDIALGLYNRGDYGTGHGWASVHSVAWSCDMDGARLVAQQPPTAQNYAIGCFGDVSGDGPFEHPEGFIEGTDQAELNPPSLYEAQLADRQ